MTREGAHRRPGIDLDQNCLAWMWSRLIMIPAPFHRPVELGSHVLMFCAWVGWYCFEFYQVMQPTWYPNNGAPAHELTSVIGIGDVRKFHIGTDAEPGSAAAIAPASEPEVKAIGEGAPQPKVTKKIDLTAATAGSKRKRVVQPRQRDPKVAYGSQSSFGNYRSWGNQTWGSNGSWSGNQAWSSNQTWGSNRSSGSNQAWGNDRSRGNDRSWGSYQTPSSPQSRH
jgi:hypothetical protein